MYDSQTYGSIGLVDCGDRSCNSSANIGPDDERECLYQGYFSIGHSRYHDRSSHSTGLNGSGEKSTICKGKKWFLKDVLIDFIQVI
ncbi:hypothetical protein B879_03024 [Cecembia lonarensis LW9]|uniref:Uncharacterized protein n=1 Tax=Cecembia lonarensis (strain CCUG 58316 / KCTC 22772 / LW9) TaxID=1225176 RepID=K1KW23_CECL9|nr:hypothetical protein B879_03024 [Cecembia lonarensis LW9]